MILFVAQFPWPLGRHVVQIANAMGQVLDKVRLKVRGAGVRNGTGNTRH
jgi:penicillin-binding protein 1C